MKRHFKNIYGLSIKFFYQLIYWALSYLPIFKLYQPVWGQNKSQGLTRQCEDRWNVFSKHLPKTKGSILDIGCNLGYFSFKSGDLGHFANGIEADHFNITCCNAIKSVQKADNTLFMKQLINPSFVSTMPTYDTIINLSVFHHWVKAYGENQAKDMMRTLASKCSCMIFETGQPNEKGTKWQEQLAFMGEKPEVGIAEFLNEIGFAKVDMIGTFPTGLTNVDRYLFVAKKI